jgi:hypothetical protein
VPVGCAVLQLRRLVVGFLLRRPGFVPWQSMWDSWWTKWHWTNFSPSPSVFPCHRCSIFTHVSYGGWTMGPLAAAVPQTVLPITTTKNACWIVPFEDTIWLSQHGMYKPSPFISPSIKEYRCHRIKVPRNSTSLHVQDGIGHPMGIQRP